MELILPFSEMGRQNEHINDRGEARCQNCSKNTHLQGKYKNKVEKYIGQTAGGGCQHGQLRVSVITHKGIQNIAQNKCR